MGSEDAGERKSTWLAVLNSSGVTALITTLVGGLFVSLITSQYQDKAKEVDRARAETNDYLERERKVVEDSFNITGRLIAASENMIQLTSASFAERGRDSSELSLLRASKQQIIKNYNDADQDWHAQRTTLALRIRMEHGADQGVSGAWEKTSTALTEYSDCSRLWFEEHSEPVDQNKLISACASRRKVLEESLDSLTQQILRFRQASSTNLK